MDERNMVEQLTLTHVSDGEQTTVDSQQISCSTGLGAYGLSGWFWSPNSRYFYYTDAREGVPDGGGGFCWDRPLIRVDMTGGGVNRLASIWAVSPEGTTVAMQQEDDLILWDLDQGEVARTPVFVPQAEVCEIAWSPDSQALAYLQTPCPFCGPGKFYLVHLGLQELQHTLLLELEEHSFVALEWETADQIRLSGYKGGEEWTLGLPVELTVQLTCLAIPQVSIEVCYPNNYSLSQNPEASRRGSFASYDFLSADAYQTPYLSEIQFFSENSIDEFTRDCDQSTPCFFGDYPDLDRYYGQREALKALENYQDFVLESFNGRHFLTMNRPCYGDDCVIREYTTFLGDVKLDIWITMADESQIGQSDQLFTRLLIQDEPSRGLRTR
jgi:hypothetical protein